MYLLHHHFFFRSELKCNGVVDCADASDELECATNATTTEESSDEEVTAIINLRFNAQERLLEWDEPESANASTPTYYNVYYGEDWKNISGEFHAFAILTDPTTQELVSLLLQRSLTTSLKCNCH